MKKYLSTTKASSRHSTIKRWRRGLYFTVAVLLVAWLFPTIVSLVSYVAMAPVVALSGWYEKSESAIPVYLRSRNELAKEIEELKRNITNQTGTQLSIRRLLEENMQLRIASGISTSSDRVVARVIAQPTRLNYDLLQIDQGARAGIVVGSPVFVGLDTVVGAVVHVTPAYSFVDLVTSSGFTGTAYLVGPNVFAPIEGVGGGVARVKVPQGIPLQVGNLVLLPSVSGGVYGEIVEVANIPTQPEQYGYVTPPIPLQSLLYVSVGTSVPKSRSEQDIETDIQKSVQEYFRLVDSVGWLMATSTASGTEENLSVDEEEIEVESNQWYEFWSPFHSPHAFFIKFY